MRYSQGTAILVACSLHLPIVVPFTTNPLPLAGPCQSVWVSVGVRTVETSPGLKRRVLDPQSSGEFREFVPFVQAKQKGENVWSQWIWGIFLHDFPRPNDDSCVETVILFVFLWWFAFKQLHLLPLYIYIYMPVPIMIIRASSPGNSSATNQWLHDASHITSIEITNG